VCVCDKSSTMILISTLRTATKGARGSPPLGRGRRCHRRGKTSRTILASKITQLQVGVPNGNKQNIPKWWSSGGEKWMKNVQKFKVFIVELEMSRLWQHFAASVINSVSGVPSPLGKSWSSLEQARPQGGGEAEGPWLLQLNEASMCRAQGFLQRPPFFENILSDPSRWKETRANGIPRLLDVSSCISIHVIHQRNLTGA
jgi:hypothetical protein